MTPPPEHGRATVDWLDARLGAARGLRKTLRYVFPEHWSFLLGEIALYSFVVLVATGTYLALFFESSTAETVYTGSYAPLRGETVSVAYDSVLRLSLDDPTGLLIRQTHHWAALLFLAAIVVHLLRIFFTGAFRTPRELNWAVGVTMLALAIVEGFAGYSMPDDLLSGMGLAIAYGVAMSLPVIGANLAFLVWGGEFPGGEEFVSRLFIAHVFVLPALLATLIAVHLAMVMRQHHTQFRGPGRREDNVVGAPLWPAYALRSLGLLCAVAAVLFLLGGLVQINPVWQWGPYEPALGTNGAQPDWYLGWLIGALRMMPPVELRLWGLTWVPNPFWGGVLFPAVVFMTLYAIPWLDRRLRRDRSAHHLLDRPRDHPRRSGLGAAFFSFVALVFVTGSADRILITFGMPYTTQIWIARAALLVVPPLAYLVTSRICRELRRSGSARSGRSAPAASAAPPPRGRARS